MISEIAKEVFFNGSIIKGATDFLKDVLVNNSFISYYNLDKKTVECYLLEYFLNCQRILY